MSSNGTIQDIKEYIEYLRLERDIVEAEIMFCPKGRLSIMIQDTEGNIDLLKEEN